MKSKLNKSLNKLKDSLNSYDFEMERVMIQMRFMSEVDELMQKHNNMNKSKLAKGVGVSSSYITQLFNGSKNLNLNTIVKFQEFFNIKFEINAKKDVSKPIEKYPSPLQKKGRIIRFQADRIKNDKLKAV